MPDSNHRVALFTDTYAPQMNGVARTLARLADAVRQRGGDVRVFATSDPASTSAEHVVRFPSVPFPMYGDLRMAAPREARVIDELQRFHPTVIHIATPFGVGLAGRRAARALELPWVSSYHTSFSAYAAHYGLPWLSKPLWRFLRSFHNSGRRTFCPTFAIRDELTAQGFERVSVWSRGVDRERFAPHKRTTAMRRRMGATHAELVVAYVGRIAKEKGLDDLLGAAMQFAPGQALTSAVIRFAFAGEGPYLEELRRRAPANCAFVGRLEGEELAAFYASADVFAFPSRTDTFGNVLIEAMSSGLPIVAAGAASSREVAGTAGQYYDGGDPGALTAILERIAANPAERLVLAERSSARAGNFDWDGVVGGLLAAYSEACTDVGTVSSAAHFSGRRAVA